MSVFPRFSDDDVKYLSLHSSKRGDKTCSYCCCTTAESKNRLIAGKVR
jgi:hypothetical protein